MLQLPSPIERVVAELPLYFFDTSALFKRYHR